MIIEDYVSFEIAKILKEKEFGQDYYNYPVYWMNGNNPTLSFEGDDDFPYNQNECVAPTLATTMKWLREKGIIITITYTMHSLSIIGHQMMFGFKIQNVQGELLAENTEVAYDSYEQAEMDAIKYSLKNLI